ncbi:MAG: hypothetical protein AB1805_15285 [Nitrospirota bacterium]
MKRSCGRGGFCVHVLLIASLVLVLLGHQRAFAAEQKEVISVDSLGSITKDTTPSGARIHLIGSLGISTADYTRGRFDDVREELNDIAVSGTLKVVFRLIERNQGWLRNLNLTLATQNAVSDEEPFDNATSPEIWYESNNFAALTTRTSNDLLFGLTYTAFTSPNDVSDTAEEVAAAVMYTGKNFIGSLSPQAKIVFPADEGDGYFAGVSITPSFNPIQGSGLTLKVPIEAGLGFDKYYTPDDDDVLAFGSAGLAAALPLEFIPKEYGNWNFSAGIHLIVRDKAIADAGRPLDDADNTIVYGTAGFSFVY